MTASPEQIKAKIRKLNADIAQRKEKIASLRNKPSAVEKTMEEILQDVLGNKSCAAPVKSFRPTSSPLTVASGQKVQIFPKEQGFEKHVQTEEFLVQKLDSKSRLGLRTIAVTEDGLSGEDDGSKNEEGSLRQQRGLRKKTSRMFAGTTTSAKLCRAYSGKLSFLDKDEEDAKVAANVKPVVKEISAEEKERILTDSKFLGFFDRASKLVERCLGQERDPLQDYSGEMETAGQGGDEKLTETVLFTDDKYTIGRPITDVRFSPRFPELLLTSYCQKESPSLHDVDGLVLVWSIGLKTRPEQVFTSNSPVLTAIFDEYNPALYLGGAYSGAILLWDARVKKSPVQRTHLSAKGHAHPVYSMQQVGTQNATNVISASTDGRVCIWSLNMLSSPQEHVELKKSGRDVAVTALSFPDEETNMLYVGAEDGGICQAHVHGTKSAPVTDSLDGHDGPVTAVDFHPQPDGAGSVYSSLLLSCSVDWSVKLWHTKKTTHAIMHFDGMYEDYVCDVKWHPVFPSVFTTVDSEGTVSLWNLNKDIEAPVFRTRSKKIAYNRCDWSSDGHTFATGDCEGNLQLWSCDKSYWHPKADDFSSFEARIETMEPIVPETKDLYGAARLRH